MNYRTVWSGPGDYLHQVNCSLIINTNPARPREILLWEHPLAAVRSEDRTFDYLSHLTDVNSSPLRNLGSDPELNEKPSQGSHELPASVRSWFFPYRWGLLSGKTPFKRGSMLGLMKTAPSCDGFYGVYQTACCATRWFNLRNSSPFILKESQLEGRWREGGGPIQS